MREKDGAIGGVGLEEEAIGEKARAGDSQDEGNENEGNAGAGDFGLGLDKKKDEEGKGESEESEGGEGVAGGGPERVFKKCAGGEEGGGKA